MKHNVDSFSTLVKKLGKGNTVDELLRLVSAHYVDTVDMEKMTETALFAIMNDLDPHSVYIPADDIEVVNEELEGSFSGIGVQFSIQDDTIMVVAVISGGPSEKVGIMAGDRIVEVNDTAFVGEEINNEKVLKKLRGPKNTQVKLGIKRHSAADILHFTVTRDDVPMNSIDIAYMIEPQIGFIRISKFAATTYNELLNALADLRNRGAVKFIIDLRENSGGLMDQTVMTINEFLPGGQMIVYSEGKAYPRFDSRADGNGSFTTQPLIVLIDEFSASASEIFAGAIQDNDRGLIVGRRSFGKGLVQQQIGLSDGSAVRLTIARYYTPSGRSIQKPYERGKNHEYEMDLINRYLHGEFDSRDSIHLIDSLVYHTSKGRTVYGGGGIMPDVFVPRDTTHYTPYFHQVVNLGYIYQFALQYADRHREQLNEYKNWQDMEGYLDSKDLLQEFTRYAETKGVEPDQAQIKRSKQLLKRLLKANIARNIIGEEGFFPLYYKDDPTVKRALQEMKTNEMLQ